MLKWITCVALTALASALAGCDKDSSTASSGGQAGKTPDGGANVTLAGGNVGLTGAGATFPQPLYVKWASDYGKTHNVRINYQGIGSGGGIKQITEKTVDFGATDGPMTEEQLKKAPGVLHIPMTMGAVVPIYNLAGVNKPLVFSGPVLAELFMGKVTKWNDAKLAQLNPGVNLPDQPVTIVHRSDGSGTSYIWTDYLAKVSKDWENGPGRATTVNWPVGRGAKGNDGVAADVKQNAGSLGYVELIYAANNNIAYGDVTSPSGNPVHASEETVSAAAAAAKNVPDDLRFSITNADSENAYPVSSLTWILVYKDQPDASKGKALMDFLWWATHDGQSTCAPMHYAPLPRELLPKVEEKIRSVTAGGQQLVAQR